MTTFPLGPYHPALSQPIGLSFKLRGETVTGVETPISGYCRRGVEHLVAGMTADQALAVMERSCGVAGQSARLAVCRAIEAATGAAPSARSRLVRAIFAEIERVLARLWLLGLAARVAGRDAGFREALEAREVLMEALEAQTGERLFWAVAEPGGVRDPERFDDLDDVRATMEELAEPVAAWTTLVGPGGALGRAGAGVAPITADRARVAGLSGLAARAAGVEGDLRRDAPYGAYAEVPFAWQADGLTPPEGGDTAARLGTAAVDLVASARLLRVLFEMLPRAEDAAVVPGPTRQGELTGHAAVEGPHGPVEARVVLAPGGGIGRLRLETPGAALVTMLPEILAGLPVALVPLALVSLDLCMECVDL
jgi:NADH-quinone oxidoreductase subunit D